MSDIRTMTRDFTREFIELYRAHPCLWQTKAKEYLDKNKKNAAYTLLVEKLQSIQPNATKQSVITKINTLRGGFRREQVQNSKRSGAALEDVYVPSLWYYELLLFLKDQEIPRQSVSNIESEEEVHEDVEDTQMIDEEENEREAGDAVSEQTEMEAHSEHSMASTSRPSTSALSSRSSPRLTKRSKQFKSHHQNINKADQILDIVATRLHHPADEFDLMGKSIAIKLRRLPREVRLYSEKLINDILFQAELGKVNEHTRITSEPNQLQPTPINNSNTLFPPPPNCVPIWTQSTPTNQLTTMNNSNTAAAYYGSYDPLQ
ncbi:unnamed protein product [Acanthoscelides obtectus]|uniref:MADF domain-containing protein n=1 Tax=Acanthoscelides obtectus TaxID=200917 RepID=A0A9P0PBJ0_ACAOB|nr:unnamed protein product [Acanthoscelides obtectus]CAK1647366.1 hypothetical protein AOBTE_LOCUS15198 [Acanthoscelides obtectus]